MAVDDIIADVVADNTLLTFQPGAGVEVIITCLPDDGSTGQNQALTDGTLTSTLNNTATGTLGRFSNFNCKIPINNTIYLTIAAEAARGHGYSGVQIK